MKPSTKRQPLLKIAFGLVAAVFILYGQAVRFDFVHYDDNAYVFRNPHVIEGVTPSSVWWALTTTENSLWLPLTRLSYLVDAELAGMNPGWFHLVNVALHATNTILLFFLLRMMTGRTMTSAAAAALFSLHPLRVESVVWVTERKDMLGMCFLLLALMLYVRYAKHRSWRAYAGSIGMFLASLSSKPMGVTLPALLLIFDWWPLGRFGRTGTVNGDDKRKNIQRSAPVTIGRLFIEKVPYLALSAAVTVVTVLANRGALQPDDIVPAPARLANAVVSSVRYLGEIVWPSNLTFYYPYDQVWLAPPVVAAAGVILTVITIAAIRVRGREPSLLAGWLWYLIALLPVIGIVQAGSQAMADRFTYLPMVGVVISAVWGTIALTGRLRAPGTARWVLFAGVVVVMGAVTFRQTGTWRDSETLFTHALEVTRDNHIATLNLANLHLSRGDVEGAIPLYREALRNRPENGAAHFNLGNILLQRGAYEEAVTHFTRALPAFQDNPLIHQNLASALMKLGREAEAEKHLREAEQLRVR